MEINNPNLVDASDDSNAMEVLSLLRKAFHLLRAEKRTNFNRLLPFGELISDRWERARFYGFGEGSSIYDSSIVLGDVRVGANCWIGPNTILDGSGGLEIGDHCDISAGSQIYSHDTVDRVIHGGPVARAPVRIGHHCYIGPNVVIVKGVTIGDYVVIGANSFVGNDIPSNTKGWGSPFRKKGINREDM